MMDRERGPIPLPKLRPQATPRDSYIRPDQTGLNVGSYGRDFLLLADALGSLGGPLARLAEEERIQAERAAQSKAELYIGGMSLSEILERRRNGTLGIDEDPITRAAINRAAGARVFLEREAERYSAIAGRLGQPDFNPHDTIRSWIAEDREVLDNDRHMEAGYAEALRASRTRLVQAHKAASLQRGEQEANTAAAQTFRAFIHSGINEGQAPEAIAQGVMALYGNIRDTLRVGEDDQDRALLAVLRDFAASGHRSVVEAIINARRESGRGLKDNISLATSLQEVLNIANARAVIQQSERDFELLRELQEKAATGQLTLEDVRAAQAVNPRILSDGGLSLLERSRAEAERRLQAALKEAEKLALRQAHDRAMGQILAENLALANKAATDGTGGLTLLRTRQVPSATDPEQATEVSADVQRKEVERYYREVLSPQIAQNSRETFDQTVRRMADWYGANGLTNPEWEKTLKAAPSMLTAEDVAKGKVPRAAEEALELYRLLKAFHGPLLSAHVDKDAEDFLDAADLLVRYSGREPRQALLEAWRSIHDPPPDLPRIEPITRTTLRAAIDDLRGNWRILGGTGPLENEDQMAREALRLSHIYRRLGVDERTALTEAGSRVARHFTKINGWAVYTGDVALPPEFTSAAEAYIAAYAEAHGEAEGIRARDLTLAPVSPRSNVWLIVHKQTGQRVGNFEASLVTPDAVVQWFRDRRAAEAAKEVERRQVRTKQDLRAIEDAGPIAGPPPGADDPTQRPRRRSERTNRQ